MIDEENEPRRLGEVGNYYMHKGLYAMVERWQDEAADAALEGNQQRAGYIEHMITRVPVMAGLR